MSKLAMLLAQFQVKLNRFRENGLKETLTRTIFIDPILEALGWEVRDPDEIQLGYPTIDSNSVDYALKIDLKIMPARYKWIDRVTLDELRKISRAG